MWRMGNDLGCTMIWLAGTVDTTSHCLITSGFGLENGVWQVSL